MTLSPRALPFPQTMHEEQLLNRYKSLIGIALMALVVTGGFGGSRVTPGWSGVSATGDLV